MATFVRSSILKFVKNFRIHFILIFSVYKTSTDDSTRSIVFLRNCSSLMLTWMALFGQRSAHRPQPLHISSMAALPFWIVIALTKQCSVHVPHPVHLSVTITSTPGIRESLWQAYSHRFSNSLAMASNMLASVFRAASAARCPTLLAQLV